MNATTTAAAGTILALDLGKFKSAAYLLPDESEPDQLRQREKYPGAHRHHHALHGADDS
jgi:hypothetical protein